MIKTYTNEISDEILVRREVLVNEVFNPHQALTCFPLQKLLCSDWVRILKFHGIKTLGTPSEKSSET